MNIKSYMVLAVAEEAVAAGAEVEASATEAAEPALGENELPK